MKRHRSDRYRRAFTLMELLIVVAAIVVLAAVLLPALRSHHVRPWRIYCVNNLRQVGLAFQVWSGDHASRFPMAVPTNSGGSAEFVEGPNAWRHFEVMSNELNTPKILYCPVEYDRTREQAMFFPSLGPRPASYIPFVGNKNVSYFVGVDAMNTLPQGLLAGDRNLSSGTSINQGLLVLATNLPTTWTHQMHHPLGNILMADLSVQSLSTPDLRKALEQTGTNINRLQMP